MDKRKHLEPGIAGERYEPFCSVDKPYILLRLAPPQPEELDFLSLNSFDFVVSILSLLAPIIGANGQVMHANTVL